MKRFYLGGFQILLFTLLGVLSFLSFSEGFQANNDPIAVKVEAGASFGPFEADSMLSWNTFLGSLSFEEGLAIAVDGSGNIYVAGNSEATWGTPVSPYVGSSDVFVAKFDPNGVLQWNTFLGATSDDDCSGIAVDGSGNIVVIGTSNDTWGAPLNPYTGGPEVFVAKLNTNGILQWNTFLGHDPGGDLGGSIAVDTSEYIYVAGWSTGTWGSPVNAFAGGQDAFAAKIDSNGVLQWNTFMGSAEGDLAIDVDVDTSGNVYVTGWSDGTWGTPVNDYVGSMDILVAKLDNSGVLQWNTFMGGTDWDEGWGIAVDGSGNIYVSGHTTVDLMGGVWEAFIGKLDNSGEYQWDMTMGSTNDDFGWDVAVDNNGYVYVAGMSVGTWGTPLNPHAGMADAYIAKLDSNGIWQWHTFMGSADFDGCGAIALDTSGNIFVAGLSDNTWGTPVNPHTGYGNFDAFVAKIHQQPEINVRFRGVRIPDGAAGNLGTRPASFIMGREFTFTIENLGASPLNLTGSPAVSLSGPQSAHFSVSQQPSSSVGSFDSTTFKLRTVRDALPGFLPVGWTYPVSFTVNIPNDDADENPYDFTINFTLEKDS